MPPIPPPNIPPIPPVRRPAIYPASAPPARPTRRDTGQALMCVYGGVVEFVRAWCETGPGSSLTVGHTVRLSWHWPLRQSLTQRKPVPVWNAWCHIQLSKSLSVFQPGFPHGPMTGRLCRDGNLTSNKQTLVCPGHKGPFGWSRLLKGEGWPVAVPSLVYIT